MKLRDVLKKNKVIHYFGVTVKKIIYRVIEPLIERILVCFRKIIHGRYNRLKRFNNIHDNERCFIVCTGPSLTFEDLELIRNEKCFGMNSIVKVLKDISWKPTYYGIQDIEVYKKLKNYINDAKFETMFVSNNIVSKSKDVCLEKAFVYPLLFSGHKYTLTNPKYKFSKDITVGVYDGYSITYSLLQIAMYMGFKEIYLLGCDCNYDKDPSKQHFVSSGHIDPNSHLMGQLQRGAFETAKKNAELMGGKIFNATRGGALEVFERVKLEDVVN